MGLAIKNLRSIRYEVFDKKFTIFVDSVFNLCSEVASDYDANKRGRILEVY